jgi:RNA polymerase sigma factor (sigma-70 family)
MDGAGETWASGVALDGLVVLAKSGDAAAFEGVVKALQGPLYGLALRMLWHPQDAEDATQEILIRIVTHLGTFRGDSAFSTWAYRVACNVLLTVRKSRMERAEITFDAFGRELDEGLEQDLKTSAPTAEDALLLEEVKIGCTLGMLLCLDREHRLAYILGEILDLDHREAAAIVEVAPAAFRKRLSRARTRIVTFTRAKCGLVEPENPCRCSRRVAPAIALGRVDPRGLLHAHDPARAAAFPMVLREIRKLDGLRRAAALYRTHPGPQPALHFAERIRALLNGMTEELAQ